MKALFSAKMDPESCTEKGIEARDFAAAPELRRSLTSFDWSDL
jgi:hypothetical protein